MPQRIDLIGGKILGHWIKFCLYIFLSVKINIKGIENIPINKNFFLLPLYTSHYLKLFFSKQFLIHQYLFLRKELLKIPLFGWHLKKIGSISIDRDKINKENLGFYEKIISVTTKTKRPILIFPQATRTPLNEKIPFKKGVSKIYEKLNFICYLLL